MSEQFTATKPDYHGGSLVNLMASIQHAIGSQQHAYPQLRQLSATELALRANLLLWVIDGLGFEHLQSAQASAPNLFAQMRGAMTSVFPPTTATAIPAYLTGQAPQQHGFTGWFMRLRELDEVVAVLPYVTRADQRIISDSAIGPGELCGLAGFTCSLDVPSYLLMPAFIADSVFTQTFARHATVLPYHTPDELPELLGDIAAAPDKAYVHIYWHGLDTLGHQHGIASAEVDTHLRMLDRVFADISQSLHGTNSVLMVTADHGFIDHDAARLIEVSEHSQLQQLLAQPLCGEPRCAYCYLKPGAEAAFIEYHQRYLSDRFALFRSRELLAAGWFGLGGMHPELPARIGDYCLVATADAVITQRLPGEAEFSMRGVHGGPSSAEMLIPLVVQMC